MEDLLEFSEDGKILLKVKDNKVTHVTIPDGVTVVGECAFRDCSSLQSIDIPKSVVNIGHYAFSGCSSLQSIDIPNSLMVINSGFCYNCTSLLKIDIPNSVTEIGVWTLAACSSLQSIDIPSSVTSIGWCTFSNCVSLQFIHLYWEDPNKCEINEEIFDGVNKDTCTLYVPSGTRWAYRHHPVWGQFKNIETVRRK